MSRLIIKNLPKTITKESLKDHFGVKGEITDVQLKYTADGKFRQFAFIGYRTEEEADKAIKYFNNTHIKTNLITVDRCAALGDTNKPKSWSKYATDNKPEQKSSGDVAKGVNDNSMNNNSNNPTAELLEKYDDDAMFQEFVQLQNKTNLIKSKRDKKTKQMSVEKIEVEEENDDDNDEEDNKSSIEEDNGKVAESGISDLEYMKHLMNKTKRKKQEKMPKAKIQLYTVKFKGLPYACKKKDLKAFLKPVIPYTIRLPRNAKGFAYAGFKTEKQFQQALSKDKSFISGKQVNVLPYSTKTDGEITEAPNKQNNKWISQEDALKNEEGIAESGCIFLRNLSYTVTEEDVEKLFAKYGPITEVDLPIDKTTRKLKGFGTVTFLMPEHAVAAYSNLDGTIAHGRMLHLLPAKVKQSADDQEDAVKTTNFKLKKNKELKSQASSSHNWNTLFMGHNEVAEAIANDFGLSKQNVLEGENVAVRLAMGETQLVAKTKDWLEQEGVCVDVFNEAPKKRSKHLLLVKNLPAMTHAKDIKVLFEPFGVLGRVVLPPSGITAIVEFCEPTEARKAFMKLAYTKYKNQPLYLEWAPEGCMKPKYEVAESVKKEVESLKSVPPQQTIQEIEETPEENTTLFVKNLHFNTTDNSLMDHFKSCGQIYYAKVATKKDVNNPKNQLSMGYGFVQFLSKKQCDNALKKLQNSLLDGKTLELKRSERTIKQTVKMVKQTANQTAAKIQNGTKILVKNVPFQAKKNEITELFRAFGEIKALRLPRKMTATDTDSHRGFAFIDYYTASDAKKAFEAVGLSTHLYGRRLVLEWASREEQVDQIRKRTADHFQQSDFKVVSKKSVLNIEDNEYLVILRLMFHHLI